MRPEPDDMLWSTIRAMAAQAPRGCRPAVDAARRMWANEHRDADGAAVIDAYERINQLFGVDADFPATC